MKAVNYHLAKIAHSDMRVEQTSRPGKKSSDRPSNTQTIGREWKLEVQDLQDGVDNCGNTLEGWIASSTGTVGPTFK